MWWRPPRPPNLLHHRRSLLRGFRSRRSAVLRRVLPPHHHRPQGRVTAQALPRQTSRRTLAEGASRRIPRTPVRPSQTPRRSPSHRIRSVRTNRGRARGQPRDNRHPAEMRAPLSPRQAVHRREGTAVRGQRSEIRSHRNGTAGRSRQAAIRRGRLAVHRRRKRIGGMGATATRLGTGSGRARGLGSPKPNRMRPASEPNVRQPISSRRIAQARGMAETVETPRATRTP